MAHKYSETKVVKLSSDPFLLSLTDQGMTYQGLHPSTAISVAACEGDYGDWTAYFAMPDTPFGNVLDYGNKMPEDAAKRIFPEWAKRGLKWRA